MGYDLVGKGGKFRATMLGWRTLLDLAIENGWKPAWTIVDDFPESGYGIEMTPSQLAEKQAQWQGGYFSNDWQIVTDEDARAIARVLSKLKLSDRDDRDFIEKFIRYCEGGSFRID